MPTVGSFHSVFWRARANTPPLPGTATGWMYPGVQSVVTLSLAIWAVPLDLLRPIWGQLRWYAHLAWRLWWWRSPEQRDRLEQWIDRLDALSPADVAVLERVAATVQSPYWSEAVSRVTACATTPKFHQPAQWVAYGRAIKKDAGQAQNVYRHVRVVHELKAAHPELSNPEAHLVTELAYQARALAGRPDRRVIDHAHI